MAEHKMPSGIRPVKGEKGVYETLSGSHRIVQDGKVWRVEGEGVESLKPAKSRGEAVAALFELGIVPEPQPAEAPKSEPEQPKVTETTQGIGGRNGKATKAPRRPRTRKQPAKAVATV
jgi:hypothetical protein